MGVHDGWSAEVAESFGFPSGSVAGSPTVVSSTGHHDLLEHINASADLLPDSIQ